MRENKTKVIALVALIIAVVGLGIGFAAFSSQLTISSGATVTPNASDWSVAFDTTYGTNGYMCVGGTIISNPTVEGTTISGLEVALTSPGESFMCMFQVKNTGKYRAYLTKVEFEEETLSCEALEEDDENFPEGYTRADDSLVSAACDGIYSAATINGFSIYARGDESLAVDNIWTINNIPDDKNELDYSLEAGTGVSNLMFGFTYNMDSVRSDGPFVIKVPDLKLTYSTTPTVQ